MINCEVSSNVILDWSKVTAQFEAQFCCAFSSNKKAHFDNVPDDYSVIDGAKEKWCSLLMLDAIIFILSNDGISSSTRRTFNQHRVLYECIFQEVQSVDPEIYQRILKDKSLPSVSKAKRASMIPRLSLKEQAEKYSHLRVRELERPWDSMHNLCVSLLDTPPSKAKNKYITMVDFLTKHERILPYTDNLNALIQVVICRVLFVLIDAKTVTDSGNGGAVKRREMSCSRDTVEGYSDGDRSPRQRTSNYASCNVGSASVPCAMMDDNLQLCVGSHFTSNCSSNSGSPASRKRVQGVKNTTKKRLSVDQYNFLPHEDADTLISPVAKCESYFSEGNLNGSNDDCDFDARLGMLFGMPTASRSVNSSFEYVQQDAKFMHMSSSVATSNMIGFSKSDRRVMPSAIQLPPLFIPQSTNRFEQDVREQADQHSGLTPTIASMKLAHANTVSGGTWRVISPLSQMYEQQQHIHSPCGLVDYEHTPTMHESFYKRSVELGCAEKQLIESSGSTPYLEDFCLTADEYQLLLECTQEHDNTQHVSVKQEMLISPKDIGDDETVFSFNPERDLLNSSGPHSLQDINVDDFDDDLLDWTPSSSFLFA